MFGLRAGDALHEEFPLSLFAEGKYSIDVYGQNGFYRSFTGDAKTPGVKVSALYERKGASLTGNVLLNLANTDTKAVTVMVLTIRMGAATVVKTLAARETKSLLLDFERSHGWYDFTVKAEGSESAAHFAGRVETGRSSFTDPLMGRVQLA